MYLVAARDAVGADLVLRAVAELEGSRLLGGHSARGLRLRGLDFILGLELCVVLK